MSTREGKLVIVCERCGKTIFRDINEMNTIPGTYLENLKYNSLPEGWELVTRPNGRGVLKVCPECWKKYQHLVVEFWTGKKG